jgi:hypothetical protein
MRRSARVLRGTAVLTLLLLLLLVPSYADLWVPQNIGLSSFLDGDLSLALDSFNRPGLTFSSSTGGLQYATFDGSSWSSSTAIDGPKYMGWGNDLTYQGTTPHVAYRSSDGTNHYLGYTTYDGASWQTNVFSDVAPSDPRHFAIGLNSEGNPGIIYYDNHTNPSADDMVYYRYYDGNSWSSREDVAGNVRVIGGVALGYDQADTPYAGFLTNMWIDRPPTLAIRDASGTWSSDVGLGGVAANEFGLYVSLAFDAVGYPHLAWVNNNPGTGDGQVNYSWYDGSAWHKDTAIEATYYTSWEDRRYMDMAIDSWGYSHIVFYDPAGKNLLYTVGRPGGFWEAPRMLASSLENPAFWVNVAIDSDNAPHFAYHSGGCTWYGVGEPVPEPGTILLLVSGIGALAVLRKRRGGTD